MTNMNTQDELPQELKDYIDNVVQEKVNDGMTNDQAVDDTVQWLEGLAAYLEKHQ